MTQSGFNWIKSYLSDQENWFNKKTLKASEKLSGSTDHSGDICNPFFWFIGVTIGIAKYFVGALTTLFAWPVSMYRDLQHMCNDSVSALTSLFCVTPIYVIVMIIVRLIVSIGCIIGFFLLLMIVILVGLYYGCKWIFNQIGDCIGNCVAFCIKSASRESVNL